MHILLYFVEIHRNELSEGVYHHGGRRTDNIKED